MAKVIKAYKGSYSHVRTFKIQVGDSTFNNEKLPTTLVRPMQKMHHLEGSHVLLVANHVNYEL